MFELKQNEGGSGDPGDSHGVEADPAQALEDLQQGVGPLGNSVNALDHCVERLVGLREFTALGFLSGWRKPSAAFS
ncbi:hypothetical protein M2162_008938 [Streptomyces sp. SAI-041]|nr:hypothetical protein [Streptomyces sp. SAI-041]